MDQQISTSTGDYTGERIHTLQNAAYLRLITPLGSYWADPTLGSRLHELRREKDLPRVRLLAAQYAQQALQPLKTSGRATSIDIETQPGGDGWLILLITVIDATGTPYNFSQSVRIM